MSWELWGVYVKVIEKSLFNYSLVLDYSFKTFPSQSSVSDNHQDNLRKSAHF